MHDPTVDPERGEHHESHNIIIQVNNHQVTVLKSAVTGFEVKQAAIAAGVRIQLDFVLSEEEPDGQARIVGDAETVHVNEHSKFLAIAPDDNS